MRLHGLDIARFAAFCGMVLVNFRIAAEVAPDAGFSASFISLLEGRAAAVFVLLAGIGYSLGQAAPWLTARRAGFLFVIGMINMTIFEADILHFYALYFVLAIPAERLGGKGLLWLAGGVLVLNLIGRAALDFNRGWDWETLEYAGFWTFPGFLRHSFYNGWHPVIPWVAFLLIGMWVGRLDLAKKPVQMRLILWGGVVATAATGLSHIINANSAEFGEAFGLSPIPPTPTYILAASGTALMAVGIILRITPTLDRTRKTHWLTAPGRQSLTLYVAHILVGMGAMEALGLLNSRLENGQILAISLGFCALTSIYAVIWAKFSKRGPLEALMRAVTG